MPQPFIIYGAGGHAGVVLDLAESLGLRPTFLVTDGLTKQQMNGLQVLSSTDEQWLGLRDYQFVVAVGDNATRAVLFDRLLARGGHALTLVHPTAFVSARAVLGGGTVVCAQAAVVAGAEVGRNCIVNTAATIDHDCRVGDHAHVCPGVHLAGNVVAGTGTMLGTGSVFIPGVHVGDRTIVGAGAVVVGNLPPDVVAYGVPASIRKSTATGHHLS